MKKTTRKQSRCLPLTSNNLLAACSSLADIFADFSRENEIAVALGGYPTIEELIQYNYQIEVPLELLRQIYEHIETKTTTRPACSTATSQQPAQLRYRD